MGRVVLQDNGRMMAVVCDGATELPVGAKREYSSYCGNYTFDGKTLITKVDAASDPSRVGSDQVRGVRFEDGPDGPAPTTPPLTAVPRNSARFTGRRSPTDSSGSAHDLGARRTGQDFASIARVMAGA